MIIPNKINYEFIEKKNITKEIDCLLEIQHNHILWSNPLLKELKEGLIKFEEVQFIFSQYYFYTKNFTKLLAAALINCENDYYRAQLSKNLWEEGGSLKIEERHTEIYRKFLKNTLCINIYNIDYHSYTKYFFNECLSYCLNSDSVECIAFLSLGIESIVPRLYTIIREGLVKGGLDKKHLEFFDIHIACDDEHAETLKEMLVSYYQEPSWFERCKKSIIYALDLRNEFFTDLYNSIQNRRVKNIINKINIPSLLISAPKQILENNIQYIDKISNIMYMNEEKENKINFCVNDTQFSSEVLDARILCIPPGFKNECHQHAHESILFVVSGQGNMLIGEETINVHNGNIVHIPRWVFHQTENSGLNELKILAVTDYNLTKIFPYNSPCSYRKKSTKYINCSNNEELL